MPYLKHFLPKKIPFFTRSTKDVQLSVVNQFFPPDYAPTGQLIEELAHQLKDNFSALEVFTTQPSYAFKQDNLPRREYIKNIKIRRSISASSAYGRIRSKTVSGVIFFLRTILHLLRYSSRRRLVLLTTAPPFLPLVGYLVSLLCNITYVCLLYDLYPEIAIELKVVKKDYWLTRLWRHLNHLTWRKSAAVIVLNSTMRDKVLNECPEISSKVFIIPSWTDPTEIKPMPRKDNWFAQQNGLVDRFTVMYSGNMGRCHDMETLLQAMIILRDTSIQFVFVGGGDKRNYMQTMSQELGLTNCLFLPYQPKENLTFSLASCNVSIVSIDERMEGLVVPSKLYSALSVGSAIAAICPAHSYLNDIFAKAKCGSTFVNGNSEGLAAYLYELSQNPRLAEELGQSGRAYCIEHYTKEKIAQSYLELFKSLLN